MKNIIIGKNKRIYVVLAVMLSLFFMLPLHSDAGLLTIDEKIVQHYEDANLVDTSVLLGEAFFDSFSGGILKIKLKNTSSASTGFDGVTNILTGIGFNLPSGMSITSGKVDMTGATAINFTAPGDNDISGEWGADNDPISGPFADIAVSAVNTSVTVMAASTDSAFASSYSPPHNTLDGPEMGLLSGNVSTSTAGGLHAIQDSVMINLTLSGSFTPTMSDPTLYAYINNRDVVLSFGSPDIVKVPEPGTLFLIGSGLIGIGILARRRSLRPAQK